MNNDHSIIGQLITIKYLIYILIIITRQYYINLELFIHVINY